MKTHSRADQLQFIRFLAFMLILIFHSSPYTKMWPGYAGKYGSANAVVFFIVLSGAVSGYSSYNKDVHFSVWESLKYVWKKLVKVYPLYFITTVFAMAESGIPELFATWSKSELKPLLIQFIKHLFLIQSWYNTEQYFSFNGVGWFLSTIMFLYLLNIPLRAIATKIKKCSKATYIFIGIFIVSYTSLSLYCYATRDTFKEFTQYIFPVSRIFEYICGMSLGYCIFPLVEKIRENQKNKIIFSMLEIISLFIWFWNMYLPMQDWQFQILHWVLPNALLIGIYLLGKGLISDLFRLDLLRYLGDISFECYLIHQVIIFQYMRNSGISNTSTILGNLFSFAFCFGVTIVTAMLLSRAKIFPSRKSNTVQ